jgi:hypothetical protein
VRVDGAGDWSLCLSLAGLRSFSWPCRGRWLSVDGGRLGCMAVGAAAVRCCVPCARFLCFAAVVPLLYLVFLGRFWRRRHPGGGRRSRAAGFLGGAAARGAWADSVPRTRPGGKARVPAACCAALGAFSRHGRAIRAPERSRSRGIVSTREAGAVLAAWSSTISATMSASVRTRGRPGGDAVTTRSPRRPNSVRAPGPR